MISLASLRSDEWTAWSERVDDFIGPRMLGSRRPRTRYAGGHYEQHRKQNVQDAYSLQKRGEPIRRKPLAQGPYLCYALFAYLRRG